LHWLFLSFGMFFIGVAFLWFGVRCESTCTEAEWSDDPCLYAEDGECDVELGWCATGDCVDCDTCASHVGCSACTAESGCGWCATSHACFSSEAACAETLTTECEIQPCTDAQWLADPCAFSLDGWCDQDLSYCATGDCVDCDTCASYVGCSACSAESGCLWCATSFTCLSNSAGCAGAVATECEDYTWFAGRYFNDPALSAQAWHLEAINVGTAWTAGITGEGVNIFILDSGVDVTHPDLLGKHVVAGSASNQQTDPTADDHGTVTASLAVGAANNSDCGVGVAFDATFSMGIFTDSDQLTAGVDSGVVHVHSNSWGVDSCTYDDDVEGTVQYWASSDACPFDGSSEWSPCVTCAGKDWSSSTIESTCVESIKQYCSFTITGIYDVACTDHWELWITCSHNALSQFAQEQLRHGVRSGRAGKGIVYVVSAGNEAALGERVNFEGFLNSIYTISVAATDQTDTHAWYSTRGVANFIAAPGGESGNGDMISALTDGACGFAGMGTSYSCPLVSGVVALMLSANPELGWRDVQHILAHTARKVDVNDASWVTNGIGLSHSDKYGFGIVDGGAATQMAQAWNSTDSKVQALHAKEVLSNLAIPTDSGATCSVIIAAPVLESLEHVVVYLNASHPFRGDIQVKLTSPSGTESLLLAHHNDGESDFAYWKLMSVVFWGEQPNGTWQVNVLDKRDNGQDGILSSFILALYGKCSTSASSCQTIIISTLTHELCADTCATANDGVCDEVWSVCSAGTDCTDCGPHVTTYDLAEESVVLGEVSCAVPATTTSTEATDGAATSTEATDGADTSTEATNGASLCSTFLAVFFCWCSVATC